MWEISWPHLSMCFVIQNTKQLNSSQSDYLKILAVGKIREKFACIRWINSTQATHLLDLFYKDKLSFLIFKRYLGFCCQTFWKLKIPLFWPKIFMFSEYSIDSTASTVFLYTYWLLLGVYTVSYLLELFRNNFDTNLTICSFPLPPFLSISASGKEWPWELGRCFPTSEFTLDSKGSAHQRVFNILIV